MHNLYIVEMRFRGSENVLPGMTFFKTHEEAERFISERLATALEPGVTCEIVRFTRDNGEVEA